VKPVDDEQGDYLFGHDIRLVSAPSYWEKIGEPASVEAASKGVMLEHPQTPFHWPFFAAFHGEPALAARHTMRFGYYTMVIRAALAGQGMALIPHGLIVEELAAGRLVNPAGLGYRSDHGYWFTRPRNLPLSQSMALFTQWIHAESEAVGIAKQA
jgi:LysR family transcriptional regulator, glycine cleavage system transcriptional activator